LTAAEQQLAASRASFEHVIGRPAEALVEHPFPNIPGTSEAVLATALEQNPTLLQRRAEAKAADENVEAARGVLLPSMSVQAQYGRSIDIIAPGVTENGVSVVGQLNIPLYQAGTEEAAIREAKEQSSQALLTSYDAERQVREDTTNAWASLRAARAAAELSTRQAASNETAYLGTTMESRVGSRSIIDILNAEQELLQSKVTAITEQQNSIIAGYRVLSVMGRMTAADLKLPVPLYDPSKHYDEDASEWFGFGN
jgi:outer membrane protein